MQEDPTALKAHKFWSTKTLNRRQMQVCATGSESTLRWLAAAKVKECLAPLKPTLDGTKVQTWAGTQVRPRLHPVDLYALAQHARQVSSSLKPPTGTRAEPVTNCKSCGSIASCARSRRISRPTAPQRPPSGAPPARTSAPRGSPCGGRGCKPCASPSRPRSAFLDLTASKGLLGAVNLA